MVEKLQKGDFIEIEFTGKIKDTGEPFDSNKKEVLKELSPKEVDKKGKPFIFSLSNGMFLEGVDEFLQGKEPGKEYTIELTPENAFGKRDPKKIERVPINVFKQNNLNPQKGAVFNFDNNTGKVIAVSGGRVLVDFNNLLAGKDVIYDVKVNRKVTDINEKAKAFIKFIFRKDIDFEIQDKKLILKADKQIKQFAEMLKDKFKEVLDLDLEVQDKDSSEKEEKNSKK
jgi:FKBP-type peptidyl-prolyl cis-trans isomerase 2